MVLKSFIVGFLGAVAALMVAAAFWFAVFQPINEPGLLWGGSVYRTKQEFGLYLKSKGLSYATWLRRNPGVAPWEPGKRAPKSGQSSEVWDWRRDALLALNAALLAAIAAALLASGRGRLRTLVDRDGTPRPSPFPTVRHAVARGLGHVEVGAGELTHAAVESMRERPRDELRLFALGAALSVAAAVLVVLILG